jgi:hypothetical protein
MLLLRTLIRCLLDARDREQHLDVSRRRHCWSSRAPGPGTQPGGMLLSPSGLRPMSSMDAASAQAQRLSQAVGPMP